MSKLQLIIKREFIAKVRNKSFIVMTFLSPLITVAMGALVYFLMKKNDEKVKKIVYVDESRLFLKEDFTDSKTVQYVDFSAMGIVETKKRVEAGDYYGALFIPKIDSLEILATSIEFYSKDSPGMSIMNSLESKIETKFRNKKLTNLGIDLDKIASSKIKTDIKMFDFSGAESSKLVNGLKIGFGALSGYLLMMFVIIYGSSVMRSVIEEKTSRIIEIIVSSVKPFQLMLGKIIGNASAGLLQFLIWGILIFILGTIATSFFGLNMTEMQTSGISPEQLEAAKQAAGADKMQLIIQEIMRLPLLKMFVLFIFYFLGGYMLYSSLFAAVGAAVDNETDTQQFMLPIMLPLVLGVYVGFATVINDPHGPIPVIFSYIPLTSPIVMLMRVPFGVSWLELAISMTILVVTFVFMVWLAAKIYRVGILMYGKKPTYKDLYKWLKYKE
ncbi:MAG: ABC transporter permease [Flavobacteriia bacterium]|nr:ABC transporter permease [Flavobacteriia bacterium]OIP47427.1 MAG: ABC transporter permease [Flavobacteriaceae bacterium CG2_30_31_66]PIV96869.1 MAG: ABC transporter permease [Flavobacteriaceae bacterium CG17_big_fil_post_rev_8_21_14_2_50_31_13]PIX14658.1 MAG: ABC transporter permease [Flavobacteriaceae bacterium CG_4_8_14_3_um_filter_31_8]PIY15669.1 MAG: ABC transporter permease [Flavobacteriaceae bacterium CG_4_10_14_3_um_filter_31_253]PIZ09510.1 MAG: ABC transporter permease [Flavobacter